MKIHVRAYERMLLGIVSVAIVLGGCSLLPRNDFTQPSVTMPKKWQGQTTSGAVIAGSEQWWKGFKDPQLDELIERALLTNNDLAAATIKVRRARLQSSLTDTNLTPSVSVTANSGINHDLNSRTTSQTHSVTGSVSYELDLWGRLASTRDAGRWEADATEVDRQSTALVLIGTAATDYWQVAYLNQRIVSSETGIAYAEKTLEVVQAKYRAGAVSGIDVAQARQTIASQRANLTQLFQQRTEARNALAILFDQAPENSLTERQSLPEGPLPTVEAGLPSSLLGRRPDLRAAELRLRESLANIDATRAGFYPAFTLTGTLGGSSISLENVLKNPIATLGVGLALPFLQWNTAQLTIKVSETQYEEAVVNFRKTLYSALSDVENALSAVAQYQAEGIHLEQALALSKKAEQLAEIRYRAGATGVQSWLDEQERRRSAETDLAGNRLNQLKNLMKLYQSLGGDMQKLGEKQ
jgi:NodT family efflux transporter outer membrane factor (OMF) lipoprotein